MYRWDTVILMTPEEREAAQAKRISEGMTLMNMDDDEDSIGNIKYEAISNLVEHPSQIRPPSKFNINRLTNLLLLCYFT